MPEPRRFPSPWSADDNGACFIVKDHNGQALAYVYYEEEPGRRAAANLLTREEARRIAVNCQSAGATSAPLTLGVSACKRTREENAP
jgi:hypothetical protein